MKNRSVWVLLVLAAAGIVAVLARGPSGAPAPAAPGPAGTAGAPAAPAATAPAVPPTAPRSAAPEVARAVEPRPDQDEPFQWDPTAPLIDQVRKLLEAVDFDPSMVRAWRARGDEVAAAVTALLSDPATTRNQREAGIHILEDLRRPSTLPSVLAAARGGADEELRVQAIRALGAFRGTVREAEVRALFEAAPSTAEKGAVADVLGELGDAASLPFLETTARSVPDGVVATAAAEAVRKVRIENSPTRDVELVQILHEEGHALRNWALERIVAGRKAEMAHHLRRVLDTHRKLPKERASATFQYHLLRGLEELAAPLSAAEKNFVDGYGAGRAVLPPE
jgi:hypothetical protein